MLRKLKIFCCFLAGIGVCSSTLRISNVFGSHMVLQHSRPVPVWGWDVEGSVVSTKVNGVEYTSVPADENGLWRIELPAFKPSLKAINLSFMNTKNEIVSLTDVLFGDVFLCSGQSNMEFSLNQVAHNTSELALVDKYPHIRVMTGTSENGNSEYKRGNLSEIRDKPYNELRDIRQSWSVASAKNFMQGGKQYFSAVCWFALKYTSDRLKGKVPLGGIVQSFGGTAIQQWSSPDALKACAGVHVSGYDCNGFRGRDSCLYYSQIHPYTIGPTQFKLALWYQGEQNAFCRMKPQIPYYRCALPALIQDWRAKLQQPSLPFGIVELAAWKTNLPIQRDIAQYGLVRLIQSNITHQLPNTFTISALDQGDPSNGDIHSPFKREVGARAALGAAAVVYGDRKVKYRGPAAVSARVHTAVTASGGKTTIHVEFDPTTLYGEPLQLVRGVKCPLAINVTQCESVAVQLGESCEWVSAEQAPSRFSLSVSGTKFSVSYDSSAKSSSASSSSSDATASAIVGVRLGNANWPLVILRNGEGLPAEPFLFENLDGGDKCESLWRKKKMMTGIH